MTNAENLEKELSEYRKEMKRIRSTWGPGPWKKEPHRKEFKAHGFDCMIIRAPLGNLCGYVGLPPGHPCYGLSYDEVHHRFPDLDVHGSITYSEKCQGWICHKPGPGSPDHLYWLGFDCAHWNDFAPYESSPIQRKIQKGVDNEMRKMYPDWTRPCSQRKYRPLNWVEMETKRFARQLRRISV